MNKEIGTSVAKNTTVMLGAQGITWISSFVLLMFLPRYLGSAAYGQLYLAISIAMILSITIDFGGNYLIPKEVAQERSKTPKILISYIGVRTIIWFICICFLLLFSYFADYSATILTLILILSVAKLWEGISKAIRSCFQGYEMMEYPSVGMIAEKVFVAVTAVTALIWGAGPITVAIIMAVGIVINLVICLKFVPRIVESLPKFNIGISVGLIKDSVPYFLWSIFAVIYYRIDAVMLSTFTTEQVVGWYGGAYRFFDVVMFLPSIFTTVIFPIFSKLSADRDEKLNDTFQRSLRYMLLAGIPMAILFFAFAENIIQLFYGLEEFGPSVLILQIFAPGIILVYLDFILGSSILATDKQRKWAVVGFAAIVLNAGLNYLMIPQAEQLWGNGGIGAALTTLVTELFIFVAAVLMLPNKYFSGISLSLPATGIAGGAIMGGIIWIMTSAGIFWPVQIILSLAAYLGVSISLGMMTEKELGFLKEFFLRKDLISFLTPKKEQI